MEINTNSFMFQYMKWLYHWWWRPPPKSLCVYFWCYIWGIICLPFNIIFFKLDKDFEIGKVLPIFYFSFLLVGFFITLENAGSWWFFCQKNLFSIIWDIHVKPIFPTLYILSVLTIIIGIVYLIAIIKLIYFNNPKKTPSIVTTYFKSIKKKICPLINYLEK